MRLLKKYKRHYIPKVVVGRRGLILLNSKIAERVNEWGEYVELYYSNENGIKTLALKFLEQFTENSYPVRKVNGVFTVRAVKIKVEPLFTKLTGIYGETNNVEFDEKNKMVIAIWRE